MFGKFGICCSDMIADQSTWAIQSKDMIDLLKHQAQMATRVICENWVIV